MRHFFAEHPIVMTSRSKTAEDKSLADVQCEDELLEAFS